MKDSFFKFKDFYLSNRLWIDLSIVILLCAFGMIMPALAFVALVGFLVLLAFNDFNNGLMLLCFISPFCAVLRVFGGDVVFVVCLAFFAVKYLIKAFKNKQIVYEPQAWLPFLALCVFMLLPIGVINGKKILYTGLVILGVALVFVATLNLKEIKIREVSISLVIGLLIACAFSTILFEIPNAKAIVQQTPIGSGFRYNALFANPNHLSEYCAIVLSIFVYRFFSENSKVENFCFAAVVTIIGMLSGSKSFMLIAIVLFGAITIVGIRDCLRFDRFKKAMLYSSPVIAIAIGLMLYVFLKRSGVFDGNFGIDSLTTGRQVIWQNALSLVGKNGLTFLFGLGMGSEIQTPPPNNYNSTHNIYIEFFQKLGIIGFALFVFVIAQFMVKETKNKPFKKYWHSLLPLFTVAAYGIVESMLNNSSVIILIPLAFIIFAIGANNCPDKTDGQGDKKGVQDIEHKNNKNKQQDVLTGQNVDDSVDRWVDVLNQNND